jgi:hypothetical protein
MNNALLFLLTMASGMLSLEKHADPDGHSKMLRMMQKNDIKKFVRTTASEEMAIQKLISFSMPDTFFNETKQLIWRGSQGGKFVELEHYASRKLQAFYWILKIYNSDYRSTSKTEFCRFLDESGNMIWDYQDLDPQQKSYYYKVILFSPTNHQQYYNKLGYIRITNDPYLKLEHAFNKWYEQMRKNGLPYMRMHNLAPIDSIHYRLE